MVEFRVKTLKVVQHYEKRSNILLSHDLRIADTNFIGK